MRGSTLAPAALLAALVLCTSCGEKKPAAADLLRNGEIYYKDRKLVEAVDQFKQFVEYYPDSSQAPRCAFMIGFIYANEFKDTLKARAAYESFLTTFPNADEGLRRSAEWELEHLGQDISNLEFSVPPAGEKIPAEEVPAGQP